MPPRSVDALRAALRAARRRTSPRQIAQEAGVSHTTVYALIGDGDAPATQIGTLDKLWAWLDTPRQESSAEKGPVLMTREDYGYIRGTLDTLERLSGGLGMQATASATTAHAMSEQLHALRLLVDQFGEAASSAAGIMRRSADGGAPPPDTTNRPRLDPEDFTEQDEGGAGEQSA